MINMVNRLYNTADNATMQFRKCFKVLDECKFYRKLSLGARYMYSVLYDRQSLSIATGWKDKKGYVYFYFDCKILADLLNISTSTVNRYKDELINHFLLIDVRQGQGMPNRMYILKPEDVDFTLISQNDYTSIVKMTYLDLSKSLCSNTESIKTQVVRLSYCHFLNEKNVAIVKYYDMLYGDYFGKIHPPVRKDRIEELECYLDELFECYDIDDAKCIIDEYFEKVANKTDGNIFYMLKARNRYIYTQSW